MNTLRRACFMLGAVSTLAVLQSSAFAQCAFVPTAGDDNYVCSSGISAGGLTDLLGNNSLTFPSLGTGTLDGNVTFGGGLDRIEMNSGSINGTVDQGDGTDTFEISDGNVSANIQQGAGIDDFVMSGGLIQSLNQGDNRDTFFMSGGRIVNFFDDGDVAVMTGGRIGRVNMMLDNNFFDMSGGQIDGNLVTGFGNDTIRLSNGHIGGNISVSGGTDSVTITGGLVDGSILLSTGDDTLVWRGHGTVQGTIEAGPGNDRFSLADLTDNNISASKISGGDGFDRLELDTVRSFARGRYDGWETISLQRGSQFTVSETLVLGDLGSGAGSLSIDPNSKLLAGGSGVSVESFTTGQMVSVFNSGMIDLTNRGSRSFDRFLIGGHYIGDSGLVQLSSQLADDASPTDLLVIAGNTSGLTRLRVINAGGAGAGTENGIKVVQVDGTSDGRFALVGDYIFNGLPAVVGGAYAYRLFKNGINTPADGDWYLRSNILPTDPVPTEPDEPELSRPLLQPGAPTFEVYPAILLGLNELPTLQQRLGNRYWSGGGADSEYKALDAIGEPARAKGQVFEGRGFWSRIETNHAKLEPDFSSANVSHEYDRYRLEAGVDLPIADAPDGVLIGGLSIHYDNAQADIGSAFGDGRIDVDGYGVRGTLTWWETSGFYVDAQASATWTDSDLYSNQLGVLADGNDGLGYGLSLEAGKQFELGQDLNLTPQVQLTYSSVDFDSFSQMINGAAVANISLLDGDSLRGRLGLALDKQSSWQTENGSISRTHIYGIANLYYEFLDGTTVSLSGTSLSDRSEELWGGLGLGASYNWNDDAFSIYGEATASTSLEDFADSYWLKGVAGVRVRF